MGRKVFVSYKYGDAQVAQINDGSAASIARAIFNTPTTARHYVDKIIEKLDADGVHIYKGEEDGNDLSLQKDDTIASKLKEKIRDSSVTIVLISKGMKTWELENDQWIPWEISYSLREKTVEGRTSKSNGLLAVILPDENGSYSYYLDECGHCNTKTHKTSTLFQILGRNMFNQKQKLQFDSNCDAHYHGKVHKDDLHSYAFQVKWHEFIDNIDKHVDHAIHLRDNIGNYNIQKAIWTQ